VLGSSSSIYSDGKTSLADNTSGFFLGHDGSSSYDFAIGDASTSMKWDGSAAALTITGGTLTAPTIQTAASGARLAMSPVSTIVASDIGTAQGGSTTTITLKSGSSSYDGYYNGWEVTITSGQGNGLSATITDYDGGSKIADAVFSTAPNSTSVYRVEREQHTFLQGHTGDAEQEYPGFLFFYHDLDDWANASSRHWGKVAISAPRYSPTFAYAGFNFGHSEDGWGRLDFGLPHNTCVFRVSDTGSGSTPLTEVAKGGFEVVQAHGIKITASGAPASGTGYKLYRQGNDLYWNGAEVGGSGGAVDSIIAGALIDVSGSTGDVTVDVNLSELTSSTTNAHADYIVCLDSGTTPYKVQRNQIQLSGFINNLGWTSNAGDITAVNVSSPLTGGGSSGSVTIGHDWGSSHRMDVSSYTSVSGNFSTVLVKDAATNVNGGVHWLSASSMFESIRYSVAPYTTGYNLGKYNRYWQFGYIDKVNTGSFVSPGYLLYEESSTNEFRHGSSTQRLKDNITSLVDSESLERIKGLRPVTFTAKYQGSTTYTNTLWPFKTHYGFISEEVGDVDKNYAIWDWWISDDPEDEGYIKLKPALIESKKEAAGDVARQASLDSGGTDEEAADAFDSAYEDAGDEWTEEELEAHWNLDDTHPTALDNIAILADAVGAIKELSTKLDAAEARLAALEA